MPPKNKSTSKKKASKSKKSTTPQLSYPLPTLAEEISAGHVSSSNQEIAASKEETAPLDTVTELEKEENKMLDNSKIEEENNMEKIEEYKMLEMSEIEKENNVEKIEEENNLQETEKEEVKEADVEHNEMGEALVEELQAEEVKEADVEHNETGEALVEELQAEGDSMEEEARRADVKENVRAEHPMEKPEDEGDKQKVKEETCEDEDPSISGDEEVNEEDDPSMHTQYSPSESKKQKEFELHIGGLDKGAREEDLIQVFGVFGEIQSIRIPKYSVTQKNRGFAFVRYVSFDHTKKALEELKDGAEVKGKKIRISASLGNDTLSLGNIHKNWSKENVKTVFIKGIPTSWDESKVKDLCKQYGEIERTELPWYSISSKRKGIGFVEFSSRDSAVACVEGLNNTHFGVDINVKVSLAKPLHKSRGSKQKKGGSKLQRTDDDTKVATKESSMPKKNNDKEKMIHSKKDTQSNKESVNKDICKPQYKMKEKKVTETAQPALGNRKRGRKGVETAVKQKPSKKARRNHKYGKERGESSTGFTNSRNSYSSNAYIPHQTAYASPRSYRAPAYTGASVSQIHSNDLKPHAGFLPPANQVRNPHAYTERRAGSYHLQPTNSSTYAGGAVASLPRSSYPGYSSYSAHQAGYVYPSSGAYVYPRPYY